MPVHNSDVTSILAKVADLLEIEGANTFRVRAYRDAVRAIEGLPRSVAEMVDQGKNLSELSGIGQSIAEKIEEIVHTGHLKQLEEIEEAVPGDLSEVLTVPGLGPKRVHALHEELGIANRQDLAEAARQHKVREIEGLGAKTEQKLLEGLEKQQQTDRRRRLTDVEELADSLTEHLRGLEGVKKIVIAGSYRRRKVTVGDLDILATCKRGTAIVAHFVQYDDVEEVVSQGKTRSTVRLRGGLQVDLRVVAEVSFGAALHYFTGSKPHNIAVRKIGVGKGLKINEYGVFRGDQRVAGRTEEEVYQAVDLAYVEPEMREDRGEIDAAKKGALPHLITREDLCGDLHCHTKATDGRSSLEAMAEAAKQRGYDYLAVTDHSKRLSVARGLNSRRLREQMDAIDKLNEKFDGVRLLKGIECDILEDGSLDLDDDVLADLDVVVGSVHSKFDLSADRQTERVIRAMDNRHFNILAHPTGRMLGQREAYELDVERVMEAALQRGCYLEINAQPDRLDLNDTYCKLAKDMGLKLALSTDSHSANSLDYVSYGIDQARRGWLEPDDVVNTRNSRGLKQLLTRQ